MILKAIDKLIEREKNHKAASERGVLHWEYTGAIRAFEECKKLLKTSAIARLIEKKMYEPHIQYSHEAHCWIVSFEKHPVVAASAQLGDAIKDAIDQMEAMRDNLIN